MSEGKYIRFMETAPKPRTRTWDVVTKDPDGHFTLGTIQWFGRWRGYAFFPAAGTIYERRCLRDIAGFIEAQNAEHRKGRKKR